MTEPINPLVVDLSHWDPADDYDAVREAGIVAVIYKATEGQSYTDPTYVAQQKAAKAAGLRWGSYHFADGSNTNGQVQNYMSFACPDPDELFVLDWEDNPGGSKMSVAQAKDWITQVENQLGRPGECVIYGGNTLKEMLNGEEFFTSRRLWLCQYGSEPVLPEGWEEYWLWQYTDGDYGPAPHAVDGIGPCDINSFDGTAEELLAEWTPSAPHPGPKPEPESYVTVSISAPPEISVNVNVNGSAVQGGKRQPIMPKVMKLREAFEHWRLVRHNRREQEAKE